MALMRSNIYELVGESSALSLVSLFTPLIAGLYWKKASATGAVFSMIAGMVVWFVALLLLPEEPGEADSVWLHVPPMLYGLAAGIFGMVAGSLWRPERKVETASSSSLQ
jgi:Na+/proline symporter